MKLTTIEVDGLYESYKRGYELAAAGGTMMHTVGTAEPFSRREFDSGFEHGKRDRNSRLKAAFYRMKELQE